MLLVLRRNSGCRIINRIVRRLPRGDLLLARSVLRHNLRQRGVCLANPHPQHNPLNPRSVAALVLLDPLVLLPEQGLVRLANSSSNSSLRGLGSVPLVKLSHNNRPGSILVVSGPRSRNSSRNKQVVSSAILLLLKSPPPLDSV